MDVAVFVVMLMFFVFGTLLGNKIGHALGERAETSKQYWLYNLGVVVAGILLSAVVSLFGLKTLAGFTIGLIAGGIMGLKFGFGKSVGVWERHDRAFRVNADQVEATEAERRAKERGETPEEARERDLISVGPASGPAKTDDRPARGHGFARRGN